MVAKTAEFVNSEVKAKIDNATVIIEPADRLRGFGVAMELAEAIQLAKMILEMEEYLEEPETYDEFLGRQLDAIDPDAYYGRI